MSSFIFNLHVSCVLKV